MPISSYRANNPITVEIQDRGRYRLRELPSGSMLLCSSSQPDRNHMLGATWNGRSLFVFARDLENQAERIDFDPSAATATLAEQ